MNKIGPSGAHYYFCFNLSLIIESYLEYQEQIIRANNKNKISFKQDKNEMSFTKNKNKIVYEKVLVVKIIHNSKDSLEKA